MPQLRDRLLMNEQPDGDEPEVIRAGTGNAYPEHAMTAADAAALEPKIIA